MSEDPDDGGDDRRPPAGLEAVEDIDDEYVEPGPNVEAMEFWDRVIADMEATAEEYREEGWATMAVHPGDVTVVPEGERVGLDVLVPDDEFEKLRELVGGGVSFDSYQVFRASTGGMVFVVVGMEDTDTRTAVVYPAYYDTGQPDTNDMLDHARMEGELRSHLRILKGEYVEFTHEDPTPFFPEEDEE